MLEEWPTWKRSYPEDTELPKFMRDIDELITWRDQHAAGKEIWVTEFGWDSSTKSPPATGDFAKWQGNTDVEQAQWLVRTYLLLATRVMNRAYLYFFNDADTPQLHAPRGSRGTMFRSLRSTLLLISTKHLETIDFRESSMSRIVTHRCMSSLTNHLQTGESWLRGAPAAATGKRQSKFLQKTSVWNLQKRCRSLQEPYQRLRYLPSQDVGNRGW